MRPRVRNGGAGRRAEACQFPPRAPPGVRPQLAAAKARGRESAESPIKRAKIASDLSAQATQAHFVAQTA
jgi:hypothetical protein